jgi:hypothetical protein
MQVNIDLVVLSELWIPFAVYTYYALTLKGNGVVLRWKARTHQ